MRLVLQRVNEASVVVEGAVVGSIGRGLLVLLGIAEGDTEEEVRWGVQKTCELRIFSDDQGKFNLSLEDVGGAALVVSQFTLLADARKGRRPSFIEAARPDIAVPLYERFVTELTARGIPTATGVFGAKMSVSLINDGPVTLVLDSSK